MTEQLSILPRGEEERATFVQRLNEYIKLHEVKESANESQKDILSLIADDYVSVNPDIKKSDVNKRVKLLLDEAITAKASEQKILADEVLDDYAIISGKLI